MMEVDVELLCLLLTTLAVSVNGRLDVNVALNRPTYQYSTWSGHHSGHGNDGNNGTNLYDGPCSCTNSVAYPWWSVDLGAALYVVGVKYTSVEVYANVANNFAVGLTDISPDVTAPTWLNYAVCARYSGVVAVATTYTLMCNSDMPAYRYLIVQFPITNYGYVCELEVYIRRWEFANHPEQKMNRVVSTFQVDRRLRCMINCSLSPICDSYNYRPSDKTCQLNTHDTPLIANSTDIVSDSAWTWWSPVFCTVE